jgi:hypothetical protein
MKFVSPSHFADPNAAARRLIEIANAGEAVQDGRIYIELINGTFLKDGGTPDQYRAALARAVMLGSLADKIQALTSKPLARSQRTRPAKLAVNPRIHSVGGHAHEVRFGLTSRNGFTDLKAPSPHARFNQQQGKFNAFAVHDFGEDGASLASSSARSSRMILRSASV